MEDLFTADCIVMVIVVGLCCLDRVVILYKKRTYKLKDEKIEC